MNAVTEPTPIDGATALRLLREVVAERPDYVYEKPGHFCVYVYEGRPSCVVGHVLARAGVPIDLLAGFSGDISLITREHRGLMEDKAVRILQAAQSMQDPCRLPWSRALSHAEDTAAQLGVTA